MRYIPEPGSTDKMFSNNNRILLTITVPYMNKHTLPEKMQDIIKLCDLLRC